MDTVNHIHWYQIFNVHGNRQAPSQDIGRAFATGTVLHALASSSSANSEWWVAFLPSVHYISHACMQHYLHLRQPLVGAGFTWTMQEPVVQNFLIGTPMHQGSANGIIIYKHGSLRNVSVFQSLQLLCMHNSYLSAVWSSWKCCWGIICKSSSAQHSSGVQPRFCWINAVWKEWVYIIIII